MGAKFGHIVTEETRKKMSEAHKGKKLSEEHKRKISNALKGNKNMLGKHHSEETKRKMREAKKGYIPWHKGKTGVYSEETLEKMSRAKKGKHHSEETKRKMSEANRGEKHWNWRGGISSLRKRIWSSFKYRQWRSDVFTRDDFTCQECGRRGCKLNAHHIMPFSLIMEINDIKTYEQVMECEELWNINNGITLCEECHRKYHKINQGEMRNEI